MFLEYLFWRLPGPLAVLYRKWSILAICMARKIETTYVQLASFDKHKVNDMLPIQR